MPIVYSADALKVMEDGNIRCVDYAHCLPIAGLSDSRLNGLCCKAGIIVAAINRTARLSIRSFNRWVLQWAGNNNRRSQFMKLYTTIIVTTLFYALCHNALLHEAQRQHALADKTAREVLAAMPVLGNKQPAHLYHPHTERERSLAIADAFSIDPESDLALRWNR